MPESEINLLPEELKEIKKKEEVKSSVGNLALAFLGLSVLLSVISSGILIQLKVSEASVKSSITTETQKINDLSSIQNAANRTQLKIAALSTIIGSQKHYSLLLETLAKASPVDISVTSLSTYGDNNVSLSGTSLSYQVLSKFITSLLDPSLGGGKIFSSVDITSASLDTVSGKIRFSITIHVKEGGLS
ncbi:MAG: PilN domain-containing protein [Patescibacteria group bacterium]|nr:PilN domain-containing protein [Patescibacteria group bacterium]